MKPLNTPERKKAFLNFLLFFSITIIVILITVFFSFQVHLKDNSKIRTDLDVAENDRAFLQEFEAKMGATAYLIDSSSRVKDDYLIKKDIEKNIIAMTNMVSDSSSLKPFCNKIITNLSNWRASNELVSKFNSEREDFDKRVESLKAAERSLPPGTLPPPSQFGTK